MKEIESYIENYFGIKSKDLASIARLFENTRLVKSKYLVKMNHYSNSIHFVKSGYIRMYAFNGTGEKEITQWISSKGMFVTDLSSFIFGKQSRWNIQALSDCELYSISKENYNSIGNYTDNWSELEKLFLAKCFTTMENRIFAQLSMSAEEKVRNYFKMNPEIFLQVPLQYIASMLGMAPETLSRIRRKMTS